MPDEQSAVPDAVPDTVRDTVPDAVRDTGPDAVRDTGPDEDSLEDVQEMTTADMTVYEAVAALNMEKRPATVAAVAAMTGFPEDDVRRCLGTLTDGGRLVP
ncbi:hypothetical protein, partial [Microbispora hainanensis]